MDEKKKKSINICILYKTLIHSFDWVSVCVCVLEQSSIKIIYQMIQKILASVLYACVCSVCVLESLGDVSFNARHKKINISYGI